MSTEYQANEARRLAIHIERALGLPSPAASAPGAAGATGAAGAPAQAAPAAPAPPAPPQRRIAGSVHYVLIPAGAEGRGRGRLPARH